MKTCLLLAGCGALVAFGAASAQAETLREALITAYQQNPTLNAARAAQRATDEGVPISLADGRPSSQVQAQYTENFLNPANAFTAPERSLNGSINLTVPVYSGGSVRNGIKAAKTRVGAGQADLRGTEAAVFSNVVAAYMDVMRDEAIVSLRLQNVGALETNLQASSDRFEIGDLTRTDVAQSDARLAIAQSDLQTAEANLIRSKEIYIQLVGNAPGQLEPPPPLPNLPDGPESAVDTALDDNPDVIAARERVEASKFDVKAARGARLPQVALFTQGNYQNFLGTLGSSLINANFIQQQSSAAGGVQLTVPVYQGGRPGAQIRRAQALSGQAMEQEIATERDVIAQTRGAFASYRAAMQVIAASQVAVDSNALALEGVRAENSVGNRTVLDILDAERELLNAQVQLVTARRNAYVAGFTLLAAMGKAEARDLGLDGGILYDPSVNYDRVRRKINDWASDEDPTAQSTRTVDTPAQDAALIGPPAN
ncbi:TolC family outer membrane protein [Blastomonas sp.]|uniref:TolC family outer membrane protein n=1 Tax=Blastomonas sp. TaxID=1909299 RepID=UPI003593DB00